MSAFISAKIDAILALQPDRVLTFSDLQAEVIAELIRPGIEVRAFNQHRVDGILSMIRTLGALVGVTDRAERVLEKLQARLGDVRRRAGYRRGVRECSSRSGTSCGSPASAGSPS